MSWCRQSSKKLILIRGLYELWNLFYIKGFKASYNGDNSLVIQFEAVKWHFTDPIQRQSSTSCSSNSELTELSSFRFEIVNMDYPLILLLWSGDVFLELSCLDSSLPAASATQAIIQIPASLKMVDWWKWHSKSSTRKSAEWNIVRGRWRLETTWSQVVLLVLS